MESNITATDNSILLCKNKSTINNPIKDTISQFDVMNYLGEYLILLLNIMEEYLILL